MFLATIIKDTQLLLRDRGALASLFVLPIIFVTAFGSMFGGGGSDAEPREVAVYGEPGDATSLAMFAAIDESGLLRVRAQSSAERVREVVADEEFVAGLIIPADFDPSAGRPAELVIDLAMSIQVRGPLQGAIGGLLARGRFGAAGPGAHPTMFVAKTPPGIKEPLDNVDGFQLSVPGNAVLFGFFLALTVGLSFVEERKSGTWRRVLAAPVNRPKLLVAKLVPYYLVGLIQMAFLFGVGGVAFGMQVGGSLLGVVLMTCAVVFCAVALGLLIASFGGTEKQVGSIGSITILVMGLLGGAMVPRLIMPETMQTLGLAVPHGWALDGYYDLLIRDGTTVADVAVPILAVFGFGVAFTIVGALRFRFER